MPDQSLLDVDAAADGLDADFWSLRFVEETCESFSVQRNVQQPWAVSTDRGVMASVYAGGGYGYAATADMSRKVRTVPETVPVTFERPAVRT